MSNLTLAARAKRYGANYSLRIVLECRRSGLPVSLGFALIEQESGFRNVFGHDPTIYIGAGEVTRGRYVAYKRARGDHAQGGMQGVGPAQLTWYSYQDRADALGGCYKPAANIRTAFEHLAVLIRTHGTSAGIAAYNGAGPAAERYSRSVRALQTKWHDRLVA